MERKTTRANYIESIHEVIAASDAWSKTEPKSDERQAAYLAYEQAMGFAQIRASRLGYHESALFVDAAKVREGKDV